jgi:uncharacterized YigZ family protein
MPEPDVYRTIRRPSVGSYKEKGSRFLAFAYPVSSEAAVKDILEQLRKEYHDARHHCYAFMLGAQGEHYRASDAGEPVHSAGDPIFGQIRSFGLTEVLVVVVRYFGGTKLGVGGLINAYKTAAAEALSSAEIIEKTVQHRLLIRFDYPDTNQVMKLVRDFDLEILAQNFAARCELTLGVRRSRLDEVKAHLAQTPGELHEIDS